MIITISRYKKYFGSHDRKKSIHEISMKLWQTDFSQKNAKIFMNMSQIDNSSFVNRKNIFQNVFQDLIIFTKKYEIEK